MRRNPGRSQCARRITPSPSSRNARVSPLASVSGALPPWSARAASRPCSGAGPTACRSRTGRRVQVAAVDGVVRDQLRGRPVRVGEVRARCSAAPARPAARIARGLQPDLELDVEGARRRGCAASRGRAAAAGRRRAARRPVRNGASASSVTIQGETVVAKFFDEERAERLVLPGLDVARGPVVEQARRRTRAPRRRRSAIGLAQRVARADEDAELELVVEPPARARARARRHRRAWRWPTRPRNGVPLATIDEARPW